MENILWSISFPSQEVTTFVYLSSLPKSLLHRNINVELPDYPRDYGTPNVNPSSNPQKCREGVYIEVYKECYQHIKLKTTPLQSNSNKKSV